MLKRQRFERAMVDTTVQEGAATYQTDSCLLNTVREKLVQAAQNEGIALRQSDARVGPLKQLQAGHYAHGKQYRRMRSAMRSLRTWLGGGDPRCRTQSHQAIARTGPDSQSYQTTARPRARGQTQTLRLARPEVECIAKGKTRTPYKFGVKVSLAITVRERLRSRRPLHAWQS